MERPYDAPTCRDHIHLLASGYAKLNPLPVVEPGVRGAITGTLNLLFASDGKKLENEKRHTVLGYLFGDPEKRLKPKSAKELTDGQWYALARWLDLSRSVDRKWLPCEYFKTEALWVLAAAMQKYYQDEGQMMMALGMEEVKDGI